MKIFHTITQLFTDKKRLATVLLALAGIAVVLAYDFCLDACSALSGALLGIDLKYMGILFMGAVGILALWRKSLLCLLLLCFGAGGEIVLIGFQVANHTYCPYCLAFAAIVFAALAVNFDRAKRGWGALAGLVGLAFFWLFFSGSILPLYAAEPVLPAFGKGPVEVRIYTDYFCGPCQKEEAELMALVVPLVEKNRIRALFIDTPVHKETPIYIQTFLAAVNARHDFRQALAARAALFAAAEQKISGQEALDDFLKNRGIPTAPLADTAPVYQIFYRYLKDDKVNSTPTVVIEGPDGKQSLTGKEKILPALQKLNLPE